MNRTLRILIACTLCSVAACGDDDAQSGPATSCVATQAPTETVAGSVVGLTVAMRDKSGNAATNYSGKVKLTATDANATLPADVTYGEADAGSHPFSIALLTAGTQTVTATDVANGALHCSVAILVKPAAPKVVLTLPGNANAGYAVTVGVAMKDLFNNPVIGFTGKVTFTSSDTGTGAVTPADITFAGTEGGVASTSATFVTLGTQTLTGRDDATKVTGSAAAAVHGLVYTGPSTGRMRLVANAAQSSTQVIQLDLVANERLERTSFFTVAVGGINLIAGPGSFAVGMNLPLDTSRVMADATLFTAGAALNFTPPSAPPPPPPVPPVAIARIGSDHVLYTAVSRKRVTGIPVIAQANEVPIGGVFYSVRLKLTADGTVGPVFDGAQPLAAYRAAVRDQFGDEFVQQSDIGVGKLESGKRPVAVGLPTDRPDILVVPFTHDRV